jgi:hypothetical protein
MKGKWLGKKKEQKEMYKEWEIESQRVRERVLERNKETAAIDEEMSMYKETEMEDEGEMEGLRKGEIEV